MPDGTLAEGNMPLGGKESMELVKKKQHPRQLNRTLIKSVRRSFIL